MEEMLNDKMIQIRIVESNPFNLTSNQTLMVYDGWNKIQPKLIFSIHIYTHTFGNDMEWSKSDLLSSGT